LNSIFDDRRGDASTFHPVKGMPAVLSTVNNSGRIRSRGYFDLRSFSPNGRFRNGSAANYAGTAYAPRNNGFLHVGWRDFSAFVAVSHNAEEPPTCAICSTVASLHNSHGQREEYED
jgi:hypothetical protein